MSIDWEAVKFYVAMFVLFWWVAPIVVAAIGLIFFDTGIEDR
jgi:hypothetical protein